VYYLSWACGVAWYPCGFGSQVLKENIKAVVKDDDEQGNYIELKRIQF